jgi:restriction system protein
MAVPVACAQCNTALDEPANLPAQQRTPCPHCGSTTRAFGHSVASGMSFSESADSAVIQAVARPPDLLLQAVIVPGDYVSDGRIIESVAPAWLEIARLMQRDPSAIYQIDDRKWEEIIAGAYKKAGFEEVILTPRSGDFGRDVIAVKYGLCTVRLVDQVKAYKPSHLVTANDVRALVGVLLSDRAATHGLVTTTSDFAPRIRDDPSIQPHLPNRLQLINGPELVKRLNDLAGK